MKLALVSTILPVFNRPRMLGEAVHSVLAQSYRPIEVVIVDDGSTDDTFAQARKLAEANPGVVRVLRQENRGPGAARNLGLAHAGGEFLQFLDSDDLLLPDKFEVQVQALRSDPGAAVAYGRTVRVNEATGEARIWARTGEDIERIFPDFLMKRGWDTNSPLWRASDRQRVGAWAELRGMEDWEHDLRAGIEGLRPVRVDRHVATVRDHVDDRASGVRSGFTPAMVSALFEAHRSVWSSMRARKLTDWSYLQEFSRKLFWIARLCGEHGLLAEADEALAIAEEMMATRGIPWEVRRFRALKALVGWSRATAIGEGVRKSFRRRGR